MSNVTPSVPSVDDVIASVGGVTHVPEEDKSESKALEKALKEAKDKKKKENKENKKVEAKPKAEKEKKEPKKRVRYTNPLDLAKARLEGDASMVDIEVVSTNVKNVKVRSHIGKMIVKLAGKGELPKAHKLVVDVLKAEGELTLGDNGNVMEAMKDEYTKGTVRSMGRNIVTALEAIGAVVKDGASYKKSPGKVYDAITS